MCLKGSTLAFNFCGWQLLYDEGELAGGRNWGENQERKDSKYAPLLVNTGMMTGAKLMVGKGQFSVYTCTCVLN